MNILIAGDFCPQHRVASSIEDQKYHTVFDDVKEVVDEADYAIVNFECPVIVGGIKPIKKNGPNLHCTEQGVEALKWAGFNCVTLANNHFYDFGEEGVIRTITACKKHGLDYVGGGVNIHEAASVLYKRIDDEILAVINCCEHEFSIATETCGGSNPLNPIQQYYAIQKAKQHADYVLVIVHGGHEYYQLPSLRMQETYRFFVDAGADAVVNHHQHCYSGYEVYNGNPIFYGLGNFCFDNPKFANVPWNEGYMVILKLAPGVDFEIVPYKQCSENARITLLDATEYSEKIMLLNRIIGDSSKLISAANEYYASRSLEYSNIFEPCQMRIYKALKRRGWLPSFNSSKRRLRQENFICCESHRDVLSYFFKHQCDVTLK